MSALKESFEIKDLKVSFAKGGGVLGLLYHSRFFQWLAGLFGLYRSSLWPKRVLRKVSFSIEPGTIFGVLGVNGAGKTTLLRVVCGSLAPDSGSVTFGGKPLMAGRNMVHVVRDGLPDHYSFLDALEVDALRLGFDPSEYARFGAAVGEQLGICNGDATLQGRSLSRGTKAKASAVLSILPLLCERGTDGYGKLVLFDEVTANLDPRAKADFFEMLRKLRERFPRLTMLIATNDVDEMRLCESGIFFKDGEVLAADAFLEEIRNGQVDVRDAFNRAIGLRTTVESRSGAEPWTEELLPAPAPVKHWKMLRRRDELDHEKDPGSGLLLTIQALLPSLLAGLAAQQATGSPSRSLTLVVASALATLVLREGFRIIQREKDFYKMLDRMKVGPVTFTQHIAACTAKAGLVELTRAVAIWFVLFGSRHNEGHFVFANALLLLGVLTVAAMRSQRWYSLFGKRIRSRNLIWLGLQLVFVAVVALPVVTGAEVDWMQVAIGFLLVTVIPIHRWMFRQGSASTRARRLRTSRLLGWQVLKYAAPVLFLGTVGFEAIAWIAFSAAPGDFGALVLAYIGIVAAGLAMGISLMYVPFLDGGIPIWFAMQLIPIAGITFSGLFYDPARLWPGLREFAHLNPFSYAGQALAILEGDPGRVYSLWLSEFLRGNFPSASPLTLALSSLWILTVLYFFFSLSLSKVTYGLVQKSGRLAGE